jgi:hypothetical protein
MSAKPHIAGLTRLGFKGLGFTGIQHDLTMAFVTFLFTRPSGMYSTAEACSRSTLLKGNGQGWSTEGPSGFAGASSMGCMVSRLLPGIVHLGSGKLSSRKCSVPQRCYSEFTFHFYPIFMLTFNTGKVFLSLNGYRLAGIRLFDISETLDRLRLESGRVQGNRSPSWNMAECPRYRIDFGKNLRRLGLTCTRGIKPLIVPVQRVHYSPGQRILADREPCQPFDLVLQEI